MKYFCMYIAENIIFKKKGQAIEIKRIQKTIVRYIINIYILCVL